MSAWKLSFQLKNNAACVCAHVCACVRVCVGNKHQIQLKENQWTRRVSPTSGVRDMNGLVLMQVLPDAGPSGTCFIFSPNSVLSIVLEFRIQFFNTKFGIGAMWTLGHR